MSAISKIEWTDSTWNPVTGCTPIREGCKNCYAKRMAQRLGGRCGYDADDPFMVTMHPDKFSLPFKWKKPRTIFVCSMGDLFHEDVKYLDINKIFEVMCKANHHVYILLTKRPERMKNYILGFDQASYIKRFRHLILGVSISTQRDADDFIPHLLDTPAARRVVSAEPLLGNIKLPANLLDWVICGGESGANACPMHPDWVRSIRDQCQAAGTPLFFKRWGEWIPLEMATCKQEMKCSITGFPGSGQQMVKVGKKHAGRSLDGREWNERPR